MMRLIAIIFVLIIAGAIAGLIYGAYQIEQKPPEVELLASGKIVKIEVFQGSWTTLTRTQITFENSSIILPMLPPEQNVEYGKCYDLYSNKKNNNRWISLWECV